SNHYNQTRTEYYRQLDQASRSESGVISFMEYAISGLVDGLRSQLEHIRIQQLHVIWRDYVYEQFRDRNSRADTRRRHLILDISPLTEPVPLARLREVTPRVAAAYATKSSRTLARDLKVLRQMGLIEVGADGVSARRELILAFLPVRGGQMGDDDQEK